MTEHSGEADFTSIDLISALCQASSSSSGPSKIAPASASSNVYVSPYEIQLPDGSIAAYDRPPEDQSFGSKVWEKVKHEPLVPIGQHDTRDREREDRDREGTK